MNEFLIDPPPRLLEKIIKRIRSKERVLVLRRLVLFSVTLIISVIGFFPSLNMLLSDFNQSGFLRFSSLMFSDFSTVTVYWKSFGITLLETLPAISLALFLAVLLTLLESAKFLTRDVKNIIRTRAVA